MATLYSLPKNESDLPSPSFPKLAGEAGSCRSDILWTRGQFVSQSTRQVLLFLNLFKTHLIKTLDRNIDITELETLNDVILVLNLFVNAELVVFASNHAADPKFFEVVKQYPNLRIKIFPCPVFFPPPHTFDHSGSSWDGFFIRVAHGLSHISAYNPDMSTFPSQVTIAEASMTRTSFSINNIPAMHHSRLLSWTCPGLRKLRLGEERRLHDHDWSGYKSYLSDFILRHPLLHTIIFTPDTDFRADLVTGLPFPFLNDALRQLVAEETFSIRDITLVRDNMERDWTIDAISVVLEAPLTATKSVTTRSVLDCLQEAMPTLRQLCVEVGRHRKHTSIVSWAHLPYCMHGTTNMK